MSRHFQLEQLFRKAFSFESLLRTSPAEFHCPHAHECRIRQRVEAMWTPAIGDESTSVMVVGEAPSARYLKGARVAGKTEHWDYGEDVKALFRFVKKYLNTYPHFTDVIKCGAQKQTKQHKRVFKTRLANCTNMFLLPEIAIIRPKTILCVGSLAYETICDLRKRGAINNSTKILKLLHYGKQANLPLTTQDKEKLIWPFQLNKKSKNEMSNLSYFSK